MTLPTGTISFNQCNSELGRSATATLGADDSWMLALGNISPNTRGGATQLSMDYLRGGYYAYEGNNVNPTLGTGTTSSAPAGWNTALNGSVDDAWYGLNALVAFQINGGTSNAPYIGTNSYITFNTGYTTYGGLSGSNPPVPKIHIAAADRRAFRIYYKYYDPMGTLNPRHVRIRFEGSRYYTGGGGDQIWECTLFSRYINPTFSFAEVRNGNLAEQGGQNGIASASAYYHTMSVIQNNSGYYYSSNGGTSWSGWLYRHLAGAPT